MGEVEGGGGDGDGGGGEGGGGGGDGHGGGGDGDGGGGEGDGDGGEGGGGEQVTEAQSYVQTADFWNSKLVWMSSLLQSLKALVNSNMSAMLVALLTTHASSG